MEFIFLMKFQSIEVCQLRDCIETKISLLKKDEYHYLYITIHSY